MGQYRGWNIGERFDHAAGRSKTGKVAAGLPKTTVAPPSYRNEMTVQYSPMTWKETLALALKLGFLAAAGYAIASALLTLYGY